LEYLRSDSVRHKIIQKGKSWSFEPAIYAATFGKPSTTVDIWSSQARRGYMAVSLHSVTATGLKTSVLGLAHIPSPHTAENIKRKYNEILHYHGLDATDVFKGVCDNGSNMTKAFKVLLWEDDDDDSAVEEGEHVGEELFENNDDPMNDDLVQDIANLYLQSLFQENYRQPCTIHTLQFYVKDCIKLLPPRYANVLKKARSVCRKMHRSTKLSEAMSTQLPAPGESMWNGQFRFLTKIEH
jgi:hypothetical protein